MSKTCLALSLLLIAVRPALAQGRTTTTRAVRLVCELDEPQREMACDLVELGLVRRQDYTQKTEQAAALLQRNDDLAALERLARSGATSDRRSAAAGAALDIVRGLLAKEVQKTFRGRLRPVLNAVRAQYRDELCGLGVTERLAATGVLVSMGRLIERPFGQPAGTRAAAATEVRQYCEEPPTQPGEADAADGTGCGTDADWQPAHGMVETMRWLRDGRWSVAGRVVWAQQRADLGTAVRAFRRFRTWERDAMDNLSNCVDARRHQLDQDLLQSSALGTNALRELSALSTLVVGSDLDGLVRHAGVPGAAIAALPWQPPTPDEAAEWRERYRCGQSVATGLVLDTLHGSRPAQDAGGLQEQVDHCVRPSVPPAAARVPESTAGTAEGSVGDTATP